MKFIQRELAWVLLSGCVVMAATTAALSAESPPFPGQSTDWNGFRRYDFEVDGKPVLVVVPETAAPGRPWVWHGEFFGHKPAPDIELLKQGFHVAYLRVPDMLGSPRAVAHWNACYQELTGTYGLSPKPALVGLSRGGLYCYNWAVANPDKVACIYGDAPVCDFKSWPGGFGAGPGSTRDWKLVLEQYGFANDDEAKAYTGNPVDRLEPLAKAGVPLLHVFGDADEVVPWQENTGLLTKRYRELGGSITLIQKPGVKHHPHGLNDSGPIVEFIVRHASVPPRAVPLTRDDAVGRMAAKLEPSRLVVYKQPDQRELYLHMFDPVGAVPGDRRPCFIVIHGGGWTGGEPRRMYPFAEHFARLGCVGISVQYRLLNSRQGTTVFDCVSDGRSAVRFVRAHAEDLGIDPEKVIVSGGSAGGHVAAGTALFPGTDAPEDASSVSCVPNALVLFFPVIDTSDEGYGRAKIGDRWRELSPLHQVRPGLPPTLVFHGTGDTVTPFAGAQAFRQAMLAAGNICEMDVHEGGAHGYLMFDRELYLGTLEKTEKFLRQQGILNP